MRTMPGDDIARIHRIAQIIEQQPDADKRAAMRAELRRLEQRLEKRRG